MKITHTLLICATAVIAQLATVNSASAADRWERSIKKFEAKDQKTSPPQHGILFVGSSSIVKWNVKKFFQNLPVYNRGFGGSQVSDVLHYFDRIVKPYNPDTIVFYSGDNDISAKKTTTTVFNDVKKFVSMVHADLPNTRVILIPPKPSVARWNIYPEMKMVGEQEAKLAANDDKVEWLNVAPEMMGPDGKPNADLFENDGLHMNDKGYVIWSNMLKQKL